MAFGPYESFLCKRLHKNLLGQDFSGKFSDVSEFLPKARWNSPESLLTFPWTPDKSPNRPWTLAWTEAKPKVSRYELLHFWNKKHNHWMQCNIWAMVIWFVLISMKGHKIRKSFPQKWPHFKEKFIFLELDKLELCKI